jgi:hypothetical protein
VFDQSGGRKTIEAKPADSGPWLGRVTVRRDGTLRIPVEVELVLEDGTRQRRHWDGRSHWIALNYQGSVPLVAARVDPDLRVPLDDNLWNNARTLAGDDGTPRLSERWAYAVQLLLGALGP